MPQRCHVVAAAAGTMLAEPDAKPPLPFPETRAVLPPHGNRIAPHGMPACQAPAAAKPGGWLPGPP